MKATKDILDFPWMTEKSTAIRSTANQYVFKVKTNANKIEIKQAIEARFQVKVLSVNTVNVQGKLKRTRGILGRRNDWKKAIVRLQEGDTIKELE
ncbi:MAG: 50S ribosomal protein L23 [Fibrobacteres bacterium]|jgi:large subunit ribosomal protein L23|nr:50S ribosomal protein L23 [Fibrobacterota bacterium]